MSHSERQPRQRGVGTGVVAEPASREHACAAFSPSLALALTLAFALLTLVFALALAFALALTLALTLSPALAPALTPALVLALALALAGAAAVSAGCLFGMSLYYTPDKSAWVGRVGGGMGGFISAVQGALSL